MSLFRTDEYKDESLTASSAHLTGAHWNIAVSGKKAVLFDSLGTLCPNSSIWYMTQGKWSTHELLLHLLKQTGPVHLTIATYSMTEDPVRVLVEQKRMGFLKDVLIVADKRFRGQQPEAFQLAEQNFKVMLKDIHAKVMVLRNEQWNLVVLGSANFTRNKRNEAGVILDNADMAAFYESIISSL
jgi:hypothetical protein